METTVTINYYSVAFLNALLSRGFDARNNDNHSVKVTCSSPYELERLAQYTKQYM